MHYQHKTAALSFKFVKIQGISGSQDQKEKKTASTVTKTLPDKKSPQRKFIAATIAKSVEL